MSALALRLWHRTAAPLVPRGVRRWMAGYYRERMRRAVLTEIERLARGDGPIVAGPWAGEVGFELLYWVPFLAWVTRAFGIEAHRVVVMSRGGTRDWYAGFATEYHDVFDRITPDEFRARGTERAARHGEQKQGAMSAFDRELLAPVLRHHGVDGSRVLHPALMYRLFRPYWWGHTGLEWIEAHTAYSRLAAPAMPDGAGALPQGYAAVKFYYSDSFPATPHNRVVAREVFNALKTKGPVVSLSTGLAIDDHDAWEHDEGTGTHGIRASLSAATNLALQAAIVAGAREWVGTYGGFAYLAPFYGVPSQAYYSDRNAFSARHLALAERVFGRLYPHPLLTLHAA